MPFFKELRRKKTSSKPDKSPNKSNDSNDSNGTNGTVPTTKSSSTINSLYASSTTPSSVQAHQSTPTLITSKSTSALNPLPQRPVPLTSVSNRSSFLVCVFPLDNNVSLILQSIMRSQRVELTSLPDRD